MKRQTHLAIAFALAFLLPLTVEMGRLRPLARGGQRIAWASDLLEGSTPSEAEPDLVVTGVWLQGDQVCTQVRNVGDAPSPAGHVTALSIDGQVVTTDLVDVQLAVGERLNRCTGLSWQCDPPEDLVAACADLHNQVNEADENNNCRQEVWGCDSTPPTITSGPAVSQLGQDSASISWTTDEDAGSLVRYDSKAAGYSYQVSSTSPSKDHELVLNSLQPATTYHFVAESADAGGNRAACREGFFQTLPVDDALAPKMARLAAVGRRLPPEFAAFVEQGVAVDRVTFAMDGVQLGTDYSAPFQVPADAILLGLDPDEFYTPHSVDASAHDLDGEQDAMSVDWDGSSLLTCRSTDPSLRFRIPHDGYRIYTEGDAALPGEELLEVESKEFTGYLEWSRIPGAIPGMSEVTRGEWHAVEPVDFTLDGAPLPTTYLGHPFHQDLVLQHTFDPAGLPLGPHVLSVRAVSSRGCHMEDSIVIEVAGPPDLTFARTVTRHGTYLAVELAVTNAGTGPVSVTGVTDTLVGFQATMPAVPGEYATDVRYTYPARLSRVDITPWGGRSLDAGETWTLTYHAVPILFAGTYSRRIGGWTRVEYSGWLGTGEEVLTDLAEWVEIPGLSDPVPLDTAVEDAVAAADYLLVTRPQYLFNLYEATEVHGLLADMAELARWRGGVLGYFSGYLTLATAFETGDPLTAGNFWSGVEDEVFLADVDGDRIRAYILEEEIESPGMAFPLTHGLEEGDGLALGNLWGSCSDASAHPWQEIAVADSTERHVHVYQSGYVPDTLDFQH